MIQKLKARIEQEKGKLQQLQQDKNLVQAKLVESQEKQLYIEEARLIIQTVAQTTQQQLEFYISDLVSYALETVFNDPYKFKAEFVVRRGKTECDLWFERDGELVSPMDEAGGGPIDVASFALRLSVWSLNKTRPVIIVDEPFKNISTNYRPKASELLAEVSKKLGLQIIMVTHSDELIENSDRVFKVEKKGVISQVMEAETRGIRGTK